MCVGCRSVHEGQFVSGVEGEACVFPQPVQHCHLLGPAQNTPLGSRDADHNTLLGSSQLATPRQRGPSLFFLPSCNQAATTLSPASLGPFGPCRWLACVCSHMQVSEHACCMLAEHAGGQGPLGTHLSRRSPPGSLTKGRWAGTPRGALALWCSRAGMSPCSSRQPQR